MKAYRLSWISFIENDESLEGRSLVYAENEEEAIYKLLKDKSNEYNIKANQIQIVSVIQLTYLNE